MFYFTGTGNSLMVARKIGELIGNTEVSSIVGTEEERPSKRYETIGIVFPVYWGGLPLKVLNFLPKLKEYKESYIFGVATHAGGPDSVISQLRHELKQIDLDLAAGFILRMPSNYILGYSAPNASNIQTHLTNAERTITKFVDLIRNREKNQPSSFSGRSRSYVKFLTEVQKSDEKFWVDDNCSECELCSRVCPVRNVRMNDGKPEWMHHCEQCLACINWCPESAIQFGSSTERSGRYANPRVTIEDMERQRNSKSF
ncbi:MAG: EFR1 family ferrodoxin [Candidatus Thorarchaeota archaeon]